MRERGMFYNKKTNKYINDTQGSRTAYKRNPDNYELPIGLMYNGAFVQTNQPASITLRFSTVKQDKKFIIPNTQVEQGSQTFSYYSREDLKQKKGDFIKSLNQEFDFANDYGEVSYFDEEVGNLFITSPDYREKKKQVLPELVMGVLNVFYKYGDLDHKYIAEYPNRCVWNYLQYKVKISLKILKKYNNEGDDKWSLENLMKLAQKQNYRLQIYDNQFNIYNHNGKDAIHIPTDCRKHRKTICFMVVDNHIYPFTDQFQKSLLSAEHNDTTNDNTNFVLKEDVKTLDTINNIKNKEKREKALAQRRIEEKEAEHISIDEWEFKLELTDKYSNIYIKNRRETDSEGNVEELPATNLNQLAELLYTNTKCIYPCSIHEGDIKSIYYLEYCKDSKKKIKKWEIFADPNYLITKPICDTLGIVYRNTCVSSIGNIIYSQNNNIKHLKSDMLDEVLSTPYRAFNNKQLIGIPDDENKQKSDFNPDEPTNEYSSIDINKCYSNVLENPNTEWCVYSALDSIEPHNEKKKKIKIIGTKQRPKSYKTGWYYIETNYNKNIHGLFIPFERLFPNGWYCVSVLKLADDKKIPYTIIKKYIPKSTLPKDQFKKFVGDLYNKLGNKAKYPINSFIGRLGQRDKVKLKCKGSVITNEYDCKYFQNKDQIVKPISKHLYTSYTYKVEEAQTISSPIYNQIIQEAWCKLQLVYDSIHFTRMKTVDYTHCSELEWKFGYRGGVGHFLGEMPYEEYIRKTTTRERVTVGGAVYFNTDSVVIVGDDVNYMIKDVKFGTNRGEARIEWDKESHDYKDRINSINRRKCNEYMLEELPSVVHTKPIEDYSKNNIRELIDAGKGFQLLGMAGTGKSYTTTEIIKILQEKDITFKVASYTHAAAHNKLFEKNNIKGQTLHSLLKFNYKTLDKPNYSNLIGVEYLLIDECSLIPENFLVSFRNIKQKLKTKFILIGDYQQLDPVEKYGYDNDIISQSSLIKYITDYNRITLTKNMRSGEEGDYMFNLYNNILYGEIDISNHKLKENWRDLSTYPLIHICYTNECRDTINNLVIQDILRLSKITPYTIPNPENIDCPLIGFKKLYVRATKTQENYYNNQTFNMMEISDTNITLLDVATQTNILITYEEYHTNFDYAYAGTCHKVQGATIPAHTPFVIHQWNTVKRYMDDKKARRWLYVAISRASNSEQFHIV